MILDYCQEQMYTFCSAAAIFFDKRGKLQKRGQKGPQKGAHECTFNIPLLDCEDHMCAPTDPQVITTSSPPHKRQK